MGDMVRESDGIDRPRFLPVATHRPRVKYTDMGRVLSGGRVYRVNLAERETASIGWLYVSDEGEIYASPDKGASARLRWVGGLANRGEAVAYLRAHRDASAAWWAEAGKDRA